MNNNDNYDNVYENENDDTSIQNENTIINDIEDEDRIDSDFAEDSEAILTEHDILEMIESKPQFLKQRNDQGIYALHVACECTRNEAIIIKLIELCPEALRTTNGFGFYPFELGFINNHSEKVVMNLIESTPIDVMDSSGSNFLQECWGPYLHVAIERGQSETVIRKLIKLNPMLLQKQDINGRHPIHCALETYQSNEVIMHLIDSDPLAMQRQSSSGQKSPLHLLCRYSNDTLSWYMIQRAGAFINIKDSSGLTPLHIACRYIDFGMQNRYMDNHHTIVLVELWKNCCSIQTLM